VVKVPPLTERLAGLVPPERVGDALTRPDDESGQRRPPSDVHRNARPGRGAVSSPTEIEQAQRDVRAALTRFGREAPGRGARTVQPAPPGRLLDIRV